MGVSKAAEYLALGIACIIGGVFLLLIVIALCFAMALSMTAYGHASDGLHNMSPVPQGFYGVGHDKWHHAYSKMKQNDNGDSCCYARTGGECRPTQARFDPAAGVWHIMVDGQWKPVSPADILSPTKLLSQGVERADLSAEAHVCANRSGGVYCVVLPTSGG